MGWFTDWTVAEVNKKLHENGDQYIGNSKIGVLEWDESTQRYVRSDGWQKIDEDVEITPTAKKSKPIWLYVTIGLAAVMAVYYIIKHK